MPKRTDIKSIMVIGSGPIIIGQAAEFDYAGAQACLALKEEGYKVILVNSNPATIMTDKEMADVIYMEPLTIEFVSKVIRKERPDAIIGTLGGQTGLNLTMELSEKGILEECGVEILGTDLDAIRKGEDRELFNELCREIGEPILTSLSAKKTAEALKVAKQIGYPVIVRPAYTLGGTGGGFADNEEELITLADKALGLSPVSQILIEKSIKGFKEVEYEVIRDANDTTIIICNMENIDPVGVHTGDSAVVAPSQTLTNREYQMLRNCSLNIVRKLGIKGGCNVQLALDPHSDQYYVIEVNPRVSRSSALASKATGYPIARVSAKIACGYHLHEIKLPSTSASYEPTLDYVVTKLPRFPFDKFDSSSNKISTQMKATGEIMSIGRTFKESFLKGVRSLETKRDHLWDHKFDGQTIDELKAYISDPRDDNFFAIAQLMRLGVSLEEIHDITKIDYIFLNQWEEILDIEKLVLANKGDEEVLLKAKKTGFADTAIARMWNISEDEIFALRKKLNMFPVFKMIDVCASEFESYISYFYSSYDVENESIVTDKKKVIVLGSGPIRIGQGIEFDYSSVHAVKTLQDLGYEAIIVNNNPETVSTDYSTSDKLYFEPLTLEDVSNIIELESPLGTVVQFGGQTAINLSESLNRRGYPILGTQHDAIELAEDRNLFEKLLNEIGIKQPAGKTTHTMDRGIEIANGLGYPVLVRPSFVLGGRAMEVVNNQPQLERYLNHAFNENKENTILVDKYISGKEIEIDAISDGKEVFIPGIMEHIEGTGVHSGDSFSVYPSFSLTDHIEQQIVDITTKLGVANRIIGAFNIQFIVDKDDNVYVIELNPRSSRTNPFLSKVTDCNISRIATKAALGISLKEQGITPGVNPKPDRVFVKAPVFSNSKITGIDARLGPEMKSTGEAIGIDNELDRALYKSFIAAGMDVKNYGTIFLSVPNNLKADILPIAQDFYNLGFNIVATSGTGKFLKENGIKTKILKKVSEGTVGSDAILDSIKKKHITYVVNFANRQKNVTLSDGYMIRKAASDNHVPLFTSLDTLKIFVRVLKRITISVKSI